MSEEVQLTEEQQVALDKITKVEVGEESKLPSEQQEEVKLAGNFANVEELRKGIDNLNSTLPEYVLKGMSDEALEEHYIELRKAFSGQTKEEHKEPEKVEPKKDERRNSKPVANVSPEVATTALAKALADNARDGFMSDEVYDSLNAMGFSDKYINGQMDGDVVASAVEAVVAEEFKVTQAMVDVAGSNEEFNTIVDWANEHRPALVAKIMQTTDVETQLLMMRGVESDYNKNNQGDRMRGNGSNSGESGYKSQAEYMLDRRDKLYKTDAKYMAKVKAKFAASSFA